MATRMEHQWGWHSHGDGARGGSAQLQDQAEGPGHGQLRGSAVAVGQDVVLTRGTARRLSRGSRKTRRPSCCRVDRRQPGGGLWEHVSM